MRIRRAVHSSFLLLAFCLLVIWVTTPRHRWRIPFPVVLGRLEAKVPGSEQVTSSSSGGSSASSGHVGPTLPTPSQAVHRTVHTEQSYSETFVDIKREKFLFTDIKRKPGPKFLPNIKNPCWIERVDGKPSGPIRDGNFTGRLRCLPYFFVVGFPKCGTTDLYVRILQHPSIKEACHKEPLWWPLTRFGGTTIGNYIDCFDGLAKNISGSFNYTTVTTRRNKLITLDSSPATIWRHTIWRSIPGNNVTSWEPDVINFHDMHHMLPEAKFIALLREPVDRQYSDYLMRTRGKPQSPQRFHDGVHRSVKLFNACIAKRTTRSCVYDLGLEISMNQPFKISIGIYYQYLKDFLQVYKRDQILVIKTEEYAANVTSALTESFKLLQLDKPGASAMKRMSRAAIENKSSSLPKVGPMLPKTRDLLKAFYAPWNERLADLLNDKRFIW